MKYEVILFDIDGTLVNNISDIYDSYVEALESVGKKEIDPSRMRSSLGKSMEEMIDHLMIDEGKHEQFREIYTNSINSKIPQLIEGMQKMLQKLSTKVKLGIVTSKMNVTTTHLLNALNLKQLFEVIITVDDVKETKPNPEGITLACKKLEVKQGPHIVYIGDRLHDLEAAERANITGIGVTWGVDGQKLNTHQLVCNNVKELEHLLFNDT